MMDGGMGSLRLGLNADDRVFGAVAAEIEYMDSDGIPFWHPCYWIQKASCLSWIS